MSIFAQAPQVKEFSSCTSDNIPAELINAKEPLVLRALVKDWPICQAASISTRHAADYLRRHYQGKPVLVSVGEPSMHGRIFYNEDFTGFNYQSHRVDLNILLDQLLTHEEKENAPTFYMGSTVVDTWLPTLRNDNDLALNQFNPRVGIWLGNRTRIAAHYDLPDNIACTVAGRRRVTLFPPQQLCNLYPGPLEWAPGGQSISLVDFHNPDFDKFPKFKEAMEHALTVELEAGDALFIPSMWWHHVESLSSFNILINYWWRQVPSYMGTPMNVLQHALLTLRDLPEEQRDIWQNMFKHYIFNANEETNAHIPEHAKGFLKELDDDQARKLRAFLLKQLNR